MPWKDRVPTSPRFRPSTRSGAPGGALKIRTPRGLVAAYPVMTGAAAAGGGGSTGGAAGGVGVGPGGDDTVPVPVSSTVWELPGALSLRDRRAERLPSLMGVEVRLSPG